MSIQLVVEGIIISHYLKDAWGQDADVIPNASVDAGLKAVNGDMFSGSGLKAVDLVRLGRMD